jgi:hypothetical protein
MFGAFHAGSAAQGLAIIPEVAWEASLDIYLIAKGLKSSSRTLGGTRHAAVCGFAAPRDGGGVAADNAAPLR